MAARKGWPGCLTWLTDRPLGEGGGPVSMFAAWLLRRIRCSHSVVNHELVTGDVMRSDYRLVHRLAAKGWPVIPSH